MENTQDDDLTSSNGINGGRPISYALNQQLGATTLSAIDETARMITLTEIQVGWNVVLSNDSESGDYRSPADFRDNLVWLDGGPVQTAVPSRTTAF